MTDTDPMPFGKYKGKPMQDVPITYLHWLWHSADNRTGPVFDYIKENKSVLELEHPDLIWN